MEQNKRIYPIPEILDDGRGWRIRQDDRRIGIDYNSKMIYVPLDDDPISHCLKLQQIARIKWDDRRIQMQDTVLFKAVEDHRLSFLLHKAGVDISAGFTTEECSAPILALKGEDEAQVLSVWLRTDYTHRALDDNFIQKHHRDKLMSLFVEVRQRIREKPTKANAVAIVEWLRQQIDDVTLPPCGGRSRRPKRKVTDSCGGSDLDPESLEDYFEWAWDECEEDMKLQHIPEDVRNQLPKDLPPMISKRMEQNHVGQLFVPWGRAKIEEPARSLAATGKFMRKWTATDEGVFPRYPHRYAVDQRVFSRRIKRPGGTVVIDSSGSMGLTPEAIRQMVEHAPGCVVANYSGTGNYGVIRILAKDGKRVQDDLCHAPCGHGNIIDYPALRWAYRLSHPRIWISDLGVTGVNDSGALGNLAMCAAVVQKGRFFHGHNVDEAIQIFKRLGQFYRLQKKHGS